MSMKTLNDLFVHTLKDIHYAENAINKALPELIKAAQDEALREALTRHREETQQQIARIKEIFSIAGEKAGSEECEAINGIIAEGRKVLQEAKDTPMCDFAVLAAAHAVEHYEIGRYQSLVAYARALGMDDAVALLEESLAEETRTEEMLRDGVETRAEEDAAGEDDEEEPSDEGEAGAKAPRKSLARARQGGRKAA